MSLINFDQQGLIPVVAQDEANGDVLLLAYMNREALQRTLADGALTLWSRSRGRLWRKGERSGNTLRVSELRVNCEGNSLLAKVRLDGPGACHAGYRSCFFRRIAANDAGEWNGEHIEARLFDPVMVYGSPGPDSPQEQPTEKVNMAAFERDCRALYAAYERLRDNDFTAISETSRMLHDADHITVVDRAVARASHEFDELHGVLMGTHQHSGKQDDIILEASQVNYWLTVAAIATGLTYDDWLPHSAWLTCAEYSALGASNEQPGSINVKRLRKYMNMVASQCRAGGVHPQQVIAYDLAQMRAKYPE